MHSVKNITQVVIVAVVVIVFSIFAFQNAEYVALRFFNLRSPEIPLFIVMLGCLLLGIILTGLFSIAEVLRLTARSRKQKKEIAKLETQLTMMKQQPLLEDFSNTQPADESMQADQEEPQTPLQDK